MYNSFKITLDGAISFCENIAESDCYNDRQFYDSDMHRQVADFLMELKTLKEKKRLKRRRNRMRKKGITQNE